MKSEIKIIIIPHSPAFAVEKIINNTLSQIEVSETVLWMGGNHTGEGERCAIKGEGTFASLLMEHCPLLRKDELAFLNEEIRDPSLRPSGFAQDDSTQLLFMPSSFERCQRIAKDILNALYELPLPLTGLIVVSSNLNHFEPPKPNDKKDQWAIEKIKTLDSAGLFKISEKESMSICGLTPIIIAIEIARMLKKEKANLIHYSQHFGIGHGSFLIE